MGKVYPRQSKVPKQIRRLRSSSNKYLKPGALAQLCRSKASGTQSCRDIRQKRIALLDAKKVKGNIMLEDKVVDESPMLTPKRFEFPAIVGSMDLPKEKRTPKTPSFADYISDSRLESLPLDLQVKIICHLHHDQLRAVFHVSRKIRKAVLIARQYYFNYTTPDRSRQEMLSAMTPLPTEHWPFASKGDEKGICIPSPHTPKAPRHGPRPPNRLKLSDMRQIATVLFQESTFQTQYLVPSVMQKPLCKPQVSTRVLFYEDELCQAVAQNKLH